MKHTYKGHEISLSEHDGKFLVSINGRMYRFASLKSAQNAVDKHAVIDFTPVEVLIIETKGWGDNAISKLKKIKLIGYEERKGYRRGDVQRFYTVEGGEHIQISRWKKDGRIYPLSSLNKLTKLIEAKNEQAKIYAEAEKKIKAIRDELDEMPKANHDPRPELAD